MLKQEQALPSAKLHFSINNWHCFARSRQDHANMRWHVIAAFGAVTKVIGIFWDETIEEFLQIMSRGWISIFHDDDAATGVLNKNRHCRIGRTVIQRGDESNIAGILDSLEGRATNLINPLR